MNKRQLLAGLLAVSPVIVLLVTYLAGAMVAGDFYKLSIAVAFVVASIYAIAILRGKSIDERVDSFSAGASNSRIMYMVWIFVLAGAFAYHNCGRSPGAGCSLVMDNIGGDMRVTEWIAVLAEEILHQKAQKTSAPRTPVWMKGQPVFESEYAKKMITY